MSADNRILIAGATGNNGRALIEQLQTAGMPVRALVRNAEKNQSLISATTQLAEGDLSDPPTLDKALQGIGYAYIVTAIAPDAVSYYRHFFAAAKKAGVRGIIKVSALGAAVDSPAEILRQHGESDNMLINCGVPYAILRPNSFYQNLLWQAGQIRRRGKFSLPLADAPQSLVDIRDIAEATLKLCQNDTLDNKIYRLTGPQSLTCYQLAEQLSKVLNKPVKYLATTAKASAQAMLAAGMPQWHVSVLSKLQQLFANGDFAAINDDLATLLGRKPTTFADFSRDFASHFAR